MIAALTAKKRCLTAKPILNALIHGKKSNLPIFFSHDNPPKMNNTRHLPSQISVHMYDHRGNKKEWKMGGS